MTFHRQIRPGEEEEELFPRRRRITKLEEPKRGFVGSRFPDLADGRPALGYATLSHHNHKSWSQLRDAQGHNTRTIHAPNVREGAPEPIELLAEKTGSYVDRVKAILREHAVPERIRKGGIITTEDVYGASPEYWNRAGDWKLKPTQEVIDDPVVQAAVTLARRKHGARLVSCSLHVDEESPHIHVIAVPLVYREHAKRGRKPKSCELDSKGRPIDTRQKIGKWTLDASSIRGQSRHLEANHTEWAAECEPFHLVRGAKGSDMTEEQRRSRRNAQTGRASLAEKAARERREALEIEATIDRDLARDLRDQFELALGEVKEDREAAKKSREQAEEIEAAAAEKLSEAKAAVFAANAREAELTVLRDLADRKRLEAEEEKKAASEEKVNAIVKQQEATEMLSQADLLFNLADDMRTGVHKKLGELRDQRQALDSRQSAIDTSERHRANFLEIISAVLTPEAAIKAVIKDGKVSIAGPLRNDQREAIGAVPEVLRAAVQDMLLRVVTLDRRSAIVRQQEQAFALKLAAADEKLSAINIMVEQVRQAAEKAKAFQESWNSIPQDQRSPSIHQSSQDAEDLLAQAQLIAAFSRGPKGAGR